MNFVERMSDNNISEILFFILIFLCLFTNSKGFIGDIELGDNTVILFFILIFLLLFMENSREEII